MLYKLCELLTMIDIIYVVLRNQLSTSHQCFSWSWNFSDKSQIVCQGKFF